MIVRESPLIDKAVQGNFGLLLGTIDFGEKTSGEEPKLAQGLSKAGNSILWKLSGSSPTDERLEPHQWLARRHKISRELIQLHLHFNQLTTFFAESLQISTGFD